MSAPVSEIENERRALAELASAARAVVAGLIAVRPDNLADGEDPELQQAYEAAGKFLASLDGDAAE